MILKLTWESWHLERFSAFGGDKSEANRLGFGFQELPSNVKHCRLEKPEFGLFL